MSQNFFQFFPDVFQIPVAEKDSLLSLGVTKDQNGSYKLNPETHKSITLENLANECKRLQETLHSTSDSQKKLEVSEKIDKVNTATLDILFSEYEKNYKLFKESGVAEKIDGNGQKEKARAQDELIIVNQRLSKKEFERVLKEEYNPEKNEFSKNFDSNLVLNMLLISNPESFKQFHSKTTTPSPAISKSQSTPIFTAPSNKNPFDSFSSFISETKTNIDSLSSEIFEIFQATNSQHRSQSQQKTPQTANYDMRRSDPPFISAPTTNPNTPQATNSRHRSQSQPQQKTPQPDDMWESPSLLNINGFNFFSAPTTNPNTPQATKLNTPNTKNTYENTYDAVKMAKAAEQRARESAQRARENAERVGNAKGGVAYFTTGRDSPAAQHQQKLFENKKYPKSTPPPGKRTSPGR